MFEVECVCASFDILFFLFSCIHKFTHKGLFYHDRVLSMYMWPIPQGLFVVLGIMGSVLIFMIS